jgi:hypothetical protein
MMQLQDHDRLLRMGLTQQSGRCERCRTKSDETPASDCHEP